MPPAEPGPSRVHIWWRIHWNRWRYSVDSACNHPAHLLRVQTVALTRPAGSTAPLQRSRWTACQLCGAVLKRRRLTEEH